MTSAALVLDEDRRSFDLTVVAEPAPAAHVTASLRTRLAMTLVVVVQIAWLAALGYAMLAFV